MWLVGFPKFNRNASSLFVCGSLAVEHEGGIQGDLGQSGISQFLAWGQVWSCGASEPASAPQSPYAPRTLGALSVRHLLFGEPPCVNASSRQFCHEAGFRFAHEVYFGWTIP